MSNNINLLKELLEYVEAYENEVGNLNIKEFSIFLNRKVIPEEKEKEELIFDKSNYSNFKSYPEVEFSALLTGLYRFAKHYLKKAISDTSFRTIDEFGFLASLLKEKSLLKNELINIHHMEMSSGSEILKRLIKNGLVYEYADEKDRRAKRVSLTEKGKVEIFNSFDNMHKVSEIIVGDLKKTELQKALFMFNKLTYFHNHIYENDKILDLNDLHDKYVKSKQ